MHSKLNNIIEKQSETYRPLILVVDNDYDNLLLASYVIESLGMAFVFTDKSEECLNLVEKLLPDVVLLDIVMPKVDGLALARSIRQNKNTAHIPIIAITGLTRPEDIEKIVEAGCNSYLCKPYLLEDLELKLYAYLKRPLI